MKVLTIKSKKNGTKRGMRAINRKRDFKSSSATKNIYTLREKTFTDPVIGTLYMRKVAAVLSKIMEVFER